VGGFDVELHRDGFAVDNGRQPAPLRKVPRPEDLTERCLAVLKAILPGILQMKVEWESAAEN
jgi:hypothetical protein